MAFSKIKKILADQLGVEESKITEQSRIVEDLGADSLDVVELLMFLEDEFGIEVSEEDAVNLSTVQDIINIVNAID